MYIKNKTVNNITVTEKAFSYKLNKIVFFVKQPPIPLLGRFNAAFIIYINKEFMIVILILE